MRRRKIKVAHIINSFESGGAEAMLCSLLLRCDRSRFQPFAVALIDDLTVAAPILDAGIPLKIIGMRPGVPDPLSVARLVKHLRQLKPDVIHTWMDHSNLIGGVAAKLAGTGVVVWGVHHSDHVRALTKRSTLMTVAACGRISGRLPARIVFCSEHARQLYRDAHGFCVERMTTIPNGFDTSRFSPDPGAYLDVRRELGLAPVAPLIALAARYDPLKDHATFVRAAGILSRTRPDTHFLACGERVDRGNPALAALIAQAGIGDRCHLLGRRGDVHRLLAAADIVTSSSISEAFPLVVGEAMACGVPCVVTDVGDSAMMVHDTGRVVPPSDSDALAGAWNELLAMDGTERQRLGAAARRRVCEHFDLSVVTERYESLYLELAAKKSSRVSMLA